MAIAPYDPSAEGPSDAATLDKMQAADKPEAAANTADYNMQRQFLTDQFTTQTAPQLQSSMGASGQFGSSAAGKARDWAKEQFQNQMDTLSSGFNRSQMELKRNEAFAAMGIIL